MMILCFERTRPSGWIPPYMITMTTAKITTNRKRTTKMAVCLKRKTRKIEMEFLSCANSIDRLDFLNLENGSKCCTCLCHTRSASSSRRSCSCRRRLISRSIWLDAVDVVSEVDADWHEPEDGDIRPERRLLRSELQEVCEGLRDLAPLSILESWNEYKEQKQ